MGILFDQREFLIGPSVSLSMCKVLTDGRMDILLNQKYLLMGPSIILSLTKFSINSNIIGL